MAEPEPNDAVGYGRPPRHTRFKPGQSGNPRGRPRRKQSMADLLEPVLSEKVTVSINGIRKRVRADTAMLFRLRERALKGDLKAINIVFNLRHNHLSDNDEPPMDTNWSEEDRAILESFGHLLSEGPDNDAT
ncbi:DUF5681 domain-containing protein [Aquisediminimonas sediminicola]|uniref:DUF5681 domain-containing protein n=1 Tax=Alteraquisediminimonas sediminicola TaxID=2676787 RepID=UPI001C8D83E9|nr:DUF5681 domain-containing protein [Aquisediminimonas sediminicola]